MNKKSIYYKLLSRDLIILDEVHKSGPQYTSMILKVMEHANPPHKIGLTATINRPLIYQTYNILNILGGITYNAFLDDEFVKQNLSKVELKIIKLSYSRQEAIIQLTQLIKKINKNKIIIFNKTKEQAEEIISNLNEVEHKIFRVFSDERDTTIFDFKNSNEKSIMVTCKVGSTGFDDPDVDTIIMDRTDSTIDFYQKIGRAFRKKGDKISTIILWMDESNVKDNRKIIETIHLDLFSDECINYYKFNKEKNDINELSYESFFMYNREPYLTIPYDLFEQQFKIRAVDNNIDIKYNKDIGLLENMAYRLSVPPLYEPDFSRDTSTKETFQDLCRKLRKNDNTIKILRDNYLLWPKLANYFFGDNNLNI